MEIWDIIDERGTKTGRTIVRGEQLQQGDYHLVVHIWIVNDKSELLIQKRAEHLKLLPGLWATTGGSAVRGEDSLTAAVREAKEELGVEVDTSKMTKISTIIRKDNIADVYLVRQNVSIDDVVIQQEEVSEVKWVEKEEIEEMVRNGVFHNYGEEYFNNLFQAIYK
jgi:isopentenyldiphosphate isomerase